MHPQTNKVPENAIAVIGMDCRFPGANDTRQFWKNLVSGTESITFFTDDELRGVGIHPETIADPTYVRAAGIMEDAELFDAAFFGYTPTEAICIDPQQCQFLQTCWHALEDAGYNPYTYPGAVAVFGGTRLSTYYVNYMCADLADYGTARFMQGHIGTDRDHLCTRVSYKLHFPRQRASGLPEPAQRRVRHGPCRRQRHRHPAGARPFLPGRHDLFA